jgi:hypothetical protein
MKALSALKPLSQVRTFSPKQSNDLPVVNKGEKKSPAKKKAE